VVAWAFAVVGSLPAVALLGRPLTVVVRDAPSALPMTMPIPAAPIRAVMPDGGPPLADARDGPLRSVLPSKPDIGLTWTELVAIVWAVGFLVRMSTPTSREMSRKRPALDSFGQDPDHRCVDRGNRDARHPVRPVRWKRHHQRNQCGRGEDSIDHRRSRRLGIVQVTEVH
jgi:hypothetical protein